MPNPWKLLDPHHRLILGIEDTLPLPELPGADLAKDPA